MSTAIEDRAVDGRSRRAERQRQLRRVEILDASKRVFATKGFHASSVADVIDAAGISRGTFYLYFDGKDALFHELLNGFASQLMAAVEVVDPQSPEMAIRLHNNIKRVVDLLFDNHYLTVMLLREAIGLDAQVDTTLNRLHAFWYEMVDGALENGARWGITRKVNRRIVATAIIGSIKEVLYQYLVVQRVDVADRGEIARELLDYWLRGLAPTK